MCAVYHRAEELAQNDTYVVSCDEKTGIQALERAEPTKPVRPGTPERREHNYIRHGTLCVIANMVVSTGNVHASVTEARGEQDFLEHINSTIDTQPDAGWIFVVDRLNTHNSESLVRMVADRCGLTEDLGVKGKRGILKSRRTRHKFLEETSHRIRFVYTPLHCSWLNQIEVWFSILVRRLLKRGSFCSKSDLHDKLVSFVRYFNEVLAKPFKWTYKGKLLNA